MANEATKIGTIEIGLASGVTITSLVRESVDHETTAEIEYGKDEQNNDAYAVVSNLGNRYSVVGKIAAAVSVKKGDIITINGAKYLVEQANTSYAASFTRFSFVANKPTAMVFPT
jgi:hypothetical protein